MAERRTSSRRTIASSLAAETESVVVQSPLDLLASVSLPDPPMQLNNNSSQVVDSPISMEVEGREEAAGDGEGSGEGAGTPSNEGQLRLPIERKKSEPRVKRRQLSINTDLDKDGRVVVREPTPVPETQEVEEPASKKQKTGVPAPQDGSTLAAPSQQPANPTPMFPILAAQSQPNAQGVLPSPIPPLTPSGYTIPPLPSAGPRSAFPTTNGIPSIPTPAKQEFLLPFSNFYDSLHSSKSQLDDQIRRSAAVLESLQAAGTMIESLVKAQWRVMMQDFGTKMGRALTDLDARIKILEGNKAAGEGGVNGKTNEGGENVEDPTKLMQDVVDRVNELNERVSHVEEAEKRTE